MGAGGSVHGAELLRSLSRLLKCHFSESAGIPQQSSEILAAKLLIIPFRLIEAVIISPLKASRNS